MRSVSKRFPDELQGKITYLGRLNSIRKQMVFDKDNQDKLADCKLVQTVLGRKRLICPNEGSENHFQKHMEILCSKIFE